MVTLLHRYRHHYNRLVDLDKDPASSAPSRYDRIENEPRYRMDENDLVAEKCTK